GGPAFGRRRRTRVRARGMQQPERRAMVRVASGAAIRTAGAAVALLLAGCFGAGEADAPLLRIAGEPIEVGRVLHRNEAALDDDSLGLYRVRDLALLGDTIVLIDGNDRVLFLTSDLRVVRTFGRKGSGPGELNGAQNIRRWGERLVVSDGHNRRITFFDRDGNAERTESVPDLALTSTVRDRHGRDALLLPAYRGALPGAGARWRAAGAVRATTGAAGRPSATQDALWPPGSHRHHGSLRDHAGRTRARAGQPHRHAAALLPRGRAGNGE